MNELVETSTTAWPTIQRMIDALSAGEIVAFMSMVTLTIVLIVPRLQVIAALTGTAARIAETVLTVIEKLLARWR